MTHHILAIDASLSCTGLAILKIVDTTNFQFELVALNSIKVPQKKTDSKFQRKIDIRDVFHYFVQQYVHLIDFAVFENYAFAGNGHLCDIAEVTGLMKLVLHTADIPFAAIAPKSVKKVITGNGNASKTNVKEDLRNYLVNYDSIKPRSLDESDAIAIGVSYAINLLKSLDNEPNENQVEDRPVRKRKSKRSADE